jgi:cytochrome c oxidase subunit 1
MFTPEGPAASGWTAYTPLSDNPVYTGVYLGQDLWILASAFEFASFLMGRVNFITTALNLRAPGMTLMRLWSRCPASVSCWK